MWLHVPENPHNLPGLTIAGFCSGIGQLERAVVIALESLGHRADVCVHCEWEAVAAALLVGVGKATHHEAPVWSDMRTFDGHAWRGLVDICVAGLPCPAFSTAGKRVGNTDERAWGKDGDGPQAQFLRIVGEMRPALVFLENVGEWITGGHFQRFGEELCRMGYAIESPLFVTAESVGAPHERERVFVLAHTIGRDGQSWPGRQRVRPAGEELADGDRDATGWDGGRVCGTQETGAGAGRPDGRHAERLGASVPELAQRPRGGLGTGGEPSGGDRQPHGSDAALAHGNGCGLRLEGDEEFAPSGLNWGSGVVGDGESISQRESHDEGEPEPRRDPRGVTGGTGRRVPHYPPHRNDYRAWASVAELSPALMPAVESGVPMVVDGTSVSAADLLRVGGNSVVVSAAAVAFARLAGGIV